MNALSARRVLAAHAAAALLLGGCTLIDQRTFERAGRAPDPAAVARTSLPALPLLTLRFGTQQFDVQSAVQDAVDAVQARKPDADYDVVSPVPTNAKPDVQQAFVTQGQQDTATVATALGYAGVSLDHVHVGLRGDAGSPPREVRVFVR